MKCLSAHSFPFNCTPWSIYGVWTILMLKILQAHLLRAFVAKLKIYAIYALYPESFCDKNLAIRKVFAFCDSDAHTLKSIEWSPQTQHLKIFAACPYLETRAPGLHKLWNLTISDGRGAFFV